MVEQSGKIPRSPAGKGRGGGGGPNKGGRKKGDVRKCGNCQKPGHTYRTCKAKYIDSGDDFIPTKKSRLGAFAPDPSDVEHKRKPKRPYDGLSAAEEAEVDAVAKQYEDEKALMGVNDDEE